MRKILTLVGKKAPSLDKIAERYKSWMVCLAGGMFCLFSVIQASMLNSLNASLVATFAITANDIGKISSAYFYANIFFLFIAGILIDYISRRTILIYACALNVLAVFLFSLAQAPWQIFICHFFNGFTGTFSLTACIRLAIQWFPPRRWATVIGLITGFSGLGGIIAQLPFILAVESLGWRNTLLVDAVFGLIILAVLAMFVQDHPDARRTKNEFDPINWNNIKRTFFRVAKNKQNWLAGFYAGFMNFAGFILGALWGNLYLVQAYRIDPQYAALMTSMLFIAGIPGGPLLGLLSDYFSTRKIPMQVTALLGLIISIAILLNLISPTSLFFLVFLLFGLCGSSQALSYAVAAESNSKNSLSSSQGFVATIMMMLGLSQILFSYLVECKWNGYCENNVPIYSLEDYRRAFLIFPIAYMIAFILARLLKEEKKK